MNPVFLHDDEGARVTDFQLLFINEVWHGKNSKKDNS